MKRNVFVVLFLVLALTLVSVGCKRTVPIEQRGNHALSAYGKLTNNQVRDAIIRGGAGIGWEMQEERPGLVVGVWKARDHSVTVEIPYSTQEYVIKYRTSTNLRAENGQIHSNYNRWIERLNRHITAEIDSIKK